MNENCMSPAGVSDMQVHDFNCLWSLRNSIRFFWSSSTAMELRGMVISHGTQVTTGENEVRYLTCPPDSRDNNFGLTCSDQLHSLLLICANRQIKCSAYCANRQIKCSAYCAEAFKTFDKTLLRMEEYCFFFLIDFINEYNLTPEHLRASLIFLISPSSAQPKYIVSIIIIIIIFVSPSSQT